MNIKTLKVWIVDDEPGMCLGAKRAIDKWKETFQDLDTEAIYKVETMESGESFLERLKEDSPNILLLDGRLPGIDGMEVLEKLKDSNQSIVTIMITAYATLDKAVQATKLGAYDFLAKPFTPEELRYALRKASRNVILTEQAKKFEEEKRKVRFNFISVLAHELKSPIGAIEGYINLMKMKQLGENIAAYETMLHRMSQRLYGMRKLIGDLLDLTRIESGSSKRDLKEIKIKPLVEQVMDGYKEEAISRNISLSLICDNEIKMIADSSEIEMLLNNFISNGIKYNKDNGSLKVEVYREKNAIKFIFSDTGIGMTEEEQQKLFKEFSRIKNEKTRNIPGSGLGLSIVEKIVKLYNGKIAVKSIPDEGTTFTVELEDKTI